MQQFQIVKDFPGYVSKIEPTNTDKPYLTKGSFNVLIDEARRISSRKGYSLFGAGKTTINRIRSSHEWNTSTATEIALRSYKGVLEAYIFDAWRTVASGFADKVDFCFDAWWDFDEQIDLLLFVNGNDKIYNWSGAYTKIASVTANTITKMFSLKGTTFAFVAGSPGVNPKITDTNSGFVTAGFSVGDKIIVDNSVDNDGTYTVASVTAGEIRLSINDTLVDEVAGADLVVAVENKDTWATERFLTRGLTYGKDTTQFDITNTIGTTYRYTWDGTGVNPVINADTLPVGSQVIIEAQNFNAGNKGTFIVTGVGENYFEVTNPSGVVESDKTIGTGVIVFNVKKVVIGGVEYIYTGGEDTNTLTGVTPSPVGSVNNGDVGIQAIRTESFTPIENAKNDIISVLENQLWIASTTNRDVYVSHNDSFRDFSFSTPQRRPGEGAILSLDNPPTGFMQQESDMYIGAGKNDIYQSVFQMSADNQYEVLTIKKFKTSTGQAPISQSAITNIKNSVAFITHEPSFDTLGRLEQITTQQSKPISDVIKTDFESYNLSRAHVKYHRNNIYIALPLEGLVLIFDLENGFWQPPQVLPVSRLAVINNEIYFHSIGGNETFKLFDGFTDNDIPILFDVVFTYDSFGVREKLKKFDNFYLEVYMSQVKDGLTATLDYDFKGSAGSSEFILDGTDTDLLFSQDEEDGSLGSSPLGEQPLGGQTEDEDPEMEGFYKYRVIFTTPKRNFFEYRPKFSSSLKGVKFKIIAFGPNVSISPHRPLGITK